MKHFHFFNQAMLGLLEKGCKFNKQIVAIHEGGNRDPEYMRMNPDGKVPVLKDGQKIVIESEKIIDYIDEEVKSGKSLSKLDNLVPSHYKTKNPVAHDRIWFCSCIIPNFLL